jgi:hypothetical protein
MMGKMRAYYDGSEATSLSIELGEDGVWTLMLTADNGVPKDLDGGTVEVLCYRGTDGQAFSRTTATSASQTYTAISGANTGTATWSIASDEAVLTYGTYYLWTRLTKGGTVTFADKASTLIVR